MLGYAVSEKGSQTFPDLVRNIAGPLYLYHICISHTQAPPAYYHQIIILTTPCSNAYTFTGLDTDAAYTVGVKSKFQYDLESECSEAATGQSARERADAVLLGLTARNTRSCTTARRWSTALSR